MRDTGLPKQTTFPGAISRIGPRKVTGLCVTRNSLSLRREGQAVFVSRRHIRQHMGDYRFPSDEESVPSPSITLHAPRFFSNEYEALAGLVEGRR